MGPVFPFCLYPSFLEQSWIRLVGFVFVVLGIESKALHILGKCSTSKLQPQSMATHNPLALASQVWGYRYVPPCSERAAIISRKKKKP